MGTRVRLTRSGGFAGLSMVASVDLDELPEGEASQVRAALSQVDFDGYADPGHAAPVPGAADTYQYDLEVLGRGRRSLTVHDPIADPGLQTLLDVLLPRAEPE